MGGRRRFAERPPKHSLRYHSPELSGTAWITERILAERLEWGGRQRSLVFAVN